MPLVHRVGEAQVDFGYALAQRFRGFSKVDFVMYCPTSDAFFDDGLWSGSARRGYWEGHVCGPFEILGVFTRPHQYDNSNKLMVSKS